jgi:hypothetical protein
LKRCISTIILGQIADYRKGWLVKYNGQLVGKLVFTKSDSPWMYFHYQSECEPTLLTREDLFPNIQLCYPDHRWMCIGSNSFHILCINEREVAIKFLYRM